MKRETGLAALPDRAGEAQPAFCINSTFSLKTNSIRLTHRYEHKYWPSIEPAPVRAERRAGSIGGVAAYDAETEAGTRIQKAIYNSTSLAFHAKLLMTHDFWRRIPIIHNLQTRLDSTM